LAWSVLSFDKNREPVSFLSCKVINLEKGMPPLETALAELSSELRRAKAAGFSYAKIIHGYGSGGKGGAIRDGVRKALAGYRRSGRIRAFVPGEEFSAFSAETRGMEDACPEIAHDPDFARQNHGVTVVLL